MDNERLMQVKHSEKLYKGIILEINTDYLHVLSDQGEHIQVHHKAGHRVGEQIYFLKDDLVNLGPNKGVENRMLPPKIMRYLGAVAAVLMIIFLINSTLFNVTYAVMSLDINPSLELELNKTGEVIRVLSLNEDAKQLVSKLSLKGQSYEFAITKILDQAVLDGYNIDQKSLLIAVAPTQSGSGQMVADIQKNMAIYTERLSAEVLVGDQQSYEEIKDESISLGRHLILEEHPDYDEDDVKNLEIHDLFKRIEQENDERENDEQENDEHENDEHDMEPNDHENESIQHEDEITNEFDPHNEQNSKEDSIEKRDSIKDENRGDRKDDHNDEAHEEEQDD